MLKQLSIYVENKQGRMQHITGLLVENEINILGSMTNDGIEFGIIRMVVSDPEKAEKAVKEAGYLCCLTDVLGIEMDDEVGSLHKVLLALSDSNINVDYSYLSFNRETGTPIMVIYAEDIYEVENCMQSKGFVSVSNISRKL